MAKSKIEWTEYSWNPVTGCSPVSEGCQNCYARRMAYRLRGRCGYPEDEPFRVTMHLDRLDQPLKWKKPRMVFVCSMSDLFHENVEPTFIQDTFWVMEKAPQHIFMVLTKRPDNMRKLLHVFYSGGHELPKNIWLGVTAENQARADERIPILLQIPAAVRFVSVEPMLGPVDLELYLPYVQHPLREEWHRNGYHIRRLNRGIQSNVLDWVICGGETGPGARPMCPDWVESILYQCKEAGIPFFFKSWGDWAPWYGDEDDGCPGDPECEKINCSGCKKAHFWRFTGGGPAGYEPRDVLYSVKVGKKTAGRLLDGRTWDEFPRVP